MIGKPEFKGDHEKLENVGKNIWQKIQICIFNPFSRSTELHKHTIYTYICTLNIWQPRDQEPTHMNETILSIYPAYRHYICMWMASKDNVSFDSIHFGYASNEPCSLSVSLVDKIYTVLHDDELVHEHVFQTYSTLPRCTATTSLFTSFVATL